MPIKDDVYLAFNRGLVSPLGLGRVDIKRVALSAETHVNWMPRVLGSMSLRPGTKFLASTDSDNAARNIPFIFSTGDTAMLEFTDQIMRVWISDALMSRPTVATTITNETFTQYTNVVTITFASPGVVSYTSTDNFNNLDPVTFTTTGALPSGLTAGTTYYVLAVDTGANTFQVSATSGGPAINTADAGSGTHTVATYWVINGWTDADDAGGVSQWATGNFLELTGNGTAAAIVQQTLTIAGGDQGVEHALTIVIERGPVILRVGSTAGDDDYITESVLVDGIHSLAFTPTGAAATIQFSSTLKRSVYVDECSMEAAGTVAIATPWVAADLGLIRFDQSGDIIFTATEGYQQWSIERRGTKSWSVVLYLADDGPLRVENLGPTTITPSGLSGNITLTASSSLFRVTHVGGLFRISSTGQNVTATSTSAVDTATDPILVTGVTAQRIFTKTITGLTGTSNTVTLQRSFDVVGVWGDVETHTIDLAPTAHDDSLDNQITYYRFIVKAADWSSGSTVMTLSYPLGSIDGMVRVTGFTTDVSASAEVLFELGDVVATDIWAEGDWSDFRGWPTAVAFHEGRLGFGGRNGVWLSVSDGFYSFDNLVVGDSGPIQRTVGSGPVDQINFMMSLQRLLVGAQGSEFSVRSSSLDEPITPTNFSIKPASTQGSNTVNAIRVDTRAFFVQRGGTRLFDISWDTDTALDYASSDVTAIVPEIGAAKIVRIAVQRQPDTRIHCVLGDGTVALLVYDKVEEVLAWIKITSTGGAGLIEDVCILPGADGDSEDRVYYVVKRTINAVTKRYVERWATEATSIGGSISYLADSYLEYSGASTATITGLTHLEGEEVVVWSLGVDVGTNVSTGDSWTHLYTVASGQIVLAAATTSCVVGLPYKAQWKSAKLALLDVSRSGTIANRSQINGVSLILANVHPQGLFFGQSFSDLEPMPGVEGGTAVPANTIRAVYDEEPIPIPGDWQADARVCLEARAPRPCTVLVAVAETISSD